MLVTVKPVLSGHSKIDKTKVLKTGDSFMKVKSTAECSTHSAILLTCIKRVHTTYVLVEEIRKIIFN